MILGICLEFHILVRLVLLYAMVSSHPDLSHVLSFIGRYILILVKNIGGLLNRFLDICVVHLMLVCSLEKK